MRRSTIYLMLLSATTVAAQESNNLRPGMAGHWEFGIYPTVRNMGRDLAYHSDQWSAGFATTAAFHITNNAAIEGGLMTTWSPQTATNSHPEFHNISPTLSLLVQGSTRHTVQPYIKMGGVYDQIGYERGNPAVTKAFSVGQGGVGVRSMMGRTTAFRLEANAQVGNVRPTWTGLFGISWFLHVAKPLPPPPPQPQIVTVNHTDTVTVTVTTPAPPPTVVVDTVRVAAIVERDVFSLLDDVKFDFNMADIKPEFNWLLDSLAVRLNSEPLKNIKVEVIGYADSVGSTGYNRALGLKRATAVRSYLVGKGVLPDRISAGTGGEKLPQTSNATDGGRAMNRRVIIVRIN